jgi:hypothetical protein
MPYLTTFYKLDQREYVLSNASLEALTDLFSCSTKRLMYVRQLHHFSKHLLIVLIELTLLHSEPFLMMWI